IKGRFPKDGAKEIALSYGNLKKFFQDDSSEESFIGKKVKFEGDYYKIVGIVNSPVAAISYSKQAQKYGAVEVTDKSAEKLNSILTNLEKQGYDNPNFYIISMKLADKDQHELLSYLKKHGASYQYSSNYIYSELQLYFYKEKLKKIIPLSVVLSLILAALILIFVRKSFNLINGFLNDMSNLNFRPRANKGFIYLIMLFDFLICIPACLLVNQLIIGHSIGMIMLLPTLVISLIIFMLTLLFMSYRDKKNDFRNL
ncbi:ABC transporter ATP-binding protein, partial [Listeria welshimeri]|nr:ABC transporter ATP-binding protein [Listeria welshimeri]